MSERTFRLIMGAWLVLALLFKLPQAILALMALLTFEGITNWRIPLLVSRLRANSQLADNPLDASTCTLAFEAERALRLIIVAMLVATQFVFPQLLWWLPWFIGFALIGAGLSGICPMVLGLRGIGLR